MFHSKNIGFIQGRMSPIVNGMIQAFPWDHWQDEFRLAHENNWRLQEWTLDYERIKNNPVCTSEGRTAIHKLIEKYDIEIPSLTADFVMQKPFYKCNGVMYENLLSILSDVLIASSLVGVGIFVLPLVDRGSLESVKQTSMLFLGLDRVTPVLKELKMKIAFESDFPPDRLANFISTLDPEVYGINYDIGNSAACQYDPVEEMDAYGKRIINVHIKDRLAGGHTVPLGKGNADFIQVFSILNKLKYKGNYIFQTARAVNDDHVNVLNLYRDFVMNIVAKQCILA